MVFEIDCRLGHQRITLYQMTSRAPYLNSRMQGFGTTIFAQMSALAHRHNAINLGQGFPDVDGPIEIAEAAINAIRDGYNQYPPGQGIAELRTAIASHQAHYYDLNYDFETQVLVTAGATEAIAASLLAICEVGDEVIVFEPFYDSYAAAIALSGAKLVPVQLSKPNWEFDPEYLRRVVTPRTRALILNSPHNPTGKVFSYNELEQIAGLCVEYDLIAITDEVYEHLIFEGSHYPLANFENMQDRCISISSAAKTFSFTGWKIGWITASTKLIEAVKTVKQFLTYANGAPFQVAIAYALNEPARFCERIAPSLAESRNELSLGLEKLHFSAMKSDGTYFVTTDISDIYSGTALEFCMELPERVGVVAIPSSVFYQTPNQGEKLVRWTFCKRIDVITEALARLSKL